MGLCRLGLQGLKKYFPYPPFHGLFIARLLPLNCAIFLYTSCYGKCLERCIYVQFVTKVGSCAYEFFIWAIYTLVCFVTFPSVDNYVKFNNSEHQPYFLNRNKLP
jgi:hypothetical protein